MKLHKNLKKIIKWLRKKRNIFIYIKELFIPKNKKFIEIVIWNIKFKFVFVLIKDFFNFLLNAYLSFLERLYTFIINWLYVNIKKPLWNVYFFLFKFFTIIYNILNFNYISRIIYFFVQIKREKQWYDSYYWITVDLMRLLILRFLDFILYLLSFNYADMSWRLFKFWIIDIVIGGFFGPIYWFIRFAIVDRWVIRYYEKYRYHIRLWEVIKYAQKHFRGFFYLDEREKKRWWGNNISLEASFRRVLSGTDLDMDRERINMFRYLKNRYVWYYIQVVFVFLFYFCLFFYIFFWNIFLLLKLIYWFLKIIVIKVFNRPLVKYRYFIKKCR